MRKVVELFAGVGGFRVGLNSVKFDGKNTIESNDFKFVFFNQWEPNKQKQHAFDCYIKRFNESFNEINNSDISLINKKNIPDHDLLVGGFPCQDYSVARSLKNQEGIEGKKGVLWWQILDVLKTKKPKFVLLENVDRLLISPAKQRGRDFSIMLKCFDDQNYYVEWKVINAHDYGMAQKRKRVFIFACKKNTNYFKTFILPYLKSDKVYDFINDNKSFFTKSFNSSVLTSFHLTTLLDKSILEMSENNFVSTYYDSGIMYNSKVNTFKTSSRYNDTKLYLKDILITNKKELESLVINDHNKIEKFKYLKANKRIERISSSGHKYIYSEGKMDFPENINKASRTMLTSEGSVNRSTHVIQYLNKYRYLSPIECERLNMFPDNWTNIETMPTKMRYFLMGNALVCGIINKLKDELIVAIDMEKN